LSKPFKTKFGWHIVKVTEKMDTFDQLIPEIEQALINKDSMRKYFEQLKKEAKITNNIVKEESSEEAVTTEKSAEGKK